MNTITKTMKVRVKDNRRAVLNQMAFEVNQIWNAANEESSVLSWIPIPGIGYVNGHTSVFDISTSIKGIRKERDLGVGASTLQEVCRVHGQARKQFKKSKLRWRTSSGPRRNLGWVPVRKDAIKFINGQIRFCGHFFKVWDSYGLADYELGTGSFSQDARGRWYLSVTVKQKVQKSKGAGQIGIDLGLKTTATCSDGTELERKQYYRNDELKLAKAQRANKKKQVRNIHAKIKNRRLDTNHKFTTKLVQDNSLIVVGNVSSKALAKTKMAKSVLDAGWYQLKRQLDYKSKAMQVVYIEINEAYTSQSCSCCGCISSGSPKGRAGLGIREWTCTECGAIHDRDINAAKNILALGHESLAQGITPLNK